MKSGSLPAKADPEQQIKFHDEVLQPIMQKAERNELTLLFLDASHFVMGCDFLGYKSPTPISNGGLTLTPPGYFPGSAKGGVSQYHFYWQPPLEAILPALTPPSYPSLPDS